MKLIVVGRAAAEVGRLAARRSALTVAVVADPEEAAARDLARSLGAARWTADPLEAVSGDDGAMVVLSGELPGAARVAEAALAAGRPVLLASLPARDRQAWLELAARPGDGLMLSRPLRFDRHFAAARAAVCAGDVGTPRTVHIGWSFDAGIDPVDAATQLADIALWLLDAEPASVYALACEVAGPPLLKVNVLAARGELASLEATVDAEGFPARRDLHLLATDGEITHRTGQDDVLWSEDSAGVFEYPADAPGREVAAWLDGPAAEPGNRAGGGDLRRNLAVARALADSLASGEPRAVTEVVSR